MKKLTSITGYLLLIAACYPIKWACCQSEITRPVVGLIDNTAVLLVLALMITITWQMWHRLVGTEIEAYFDAGDRHARPMMPAVRMLPAPTSKPFGVVMLPVRNEMQTVGREQ